MKFDSKGLKERLVPNLEKGVSMAEKCDELIQDIARNVSDVHISFNVNQCTTLIEEAEKYTNDILIATRVTVSMFDSAEKANMEIIDRLYSLDGDYFEEIFGTEANYYGVAQGIVKYHIYNGLGSDEYKEVAKAYNMTYYNAAKACSLIDTSVGACSYAVAANSILMAYRFDPAAFEKDFGFPMFEVNKEKELVLNSDRLMIDMYIYYNSEENGGKLFKKASDGKLEVDEEQFLGNNSKYATNKIDQVSVNSCYRYDNDKDIYNLTIAGYEYLKSKNISKEIKVEQVLYGKKSYEEYYNNIYPHVGNRLDENLQIKRINDSEALQELLEENVNSNHIVYMAIYHSGDIIYHNTTTGIDTKTNIDLGHALYVTGTTKEGVLVSTWGKEYRITYDNLIENQNYQIYICSTNEK